MSKKRLGTDEKKWEHLLEKLKPGALTPLSQEQMLEFCKSISAKVTDGEKGHAEIAFSDGFYHMDEMAWQLNGGAVVKAQLKDADEMDWIYIRENKFLNDVTVYIGFDSISPRLFWQFKLEDDSYHIRELDKLYLVSITKDDECEKGDEFYIEDYATAIHFRNGKLSVFEHIRGTGLKAARTFILKRTAEVRARASSKSGKDTNKDMPTEETINELISEIAPEKAVSQTSSSKDNNDLPPSSKKNSRMDTLNAIAKKKGPLPPSSVANDNTPTIIPLNNDSPFPANIEDDEKEIGDETKE